MVKKSIQDQFLKNKLIRDLKTEIRDKNEQIKTLTDELKEALAKIEGVVEKEHEEVSHGA